MPSCIVSLFSRKEELNCIAVSLAVQRRSTVLLKGKKQSGDGLN